MRNLLITTCYHMGIGDLTTRLYSVVDLTLFVKKFKNIDNVFIVIEDGQTDVLSRILNVNKLESICCSFNIVNNKQLQFSIGNYRVNYKGDTYYRHFSAINNENVKTDKEGFWDCYTNAEDDDYNIDFQKFEYRDPSARNSTPIHDNMLSIYKDELYVTANMFVQNNLDSDFEVVYYRACTLDKEHLHSFINNLKSSLHLSKKYFVCSDSVYALNCIKNAFNNCISLKTKLSDGIGTASSDKSMIEDLIVEMLICGLSKKIHYAGRQAYISLFVFYAHIVKNIKLIQY